jgi:hypothetical protein
VSWPCRDRNSRTGYGLVSRDFDWFKHSKGPLGEGGHETERQWQWFIADGALALRQSAYKMTRQKVSFSLWIGLDPSIYVSSKVVGGWAKPTAVRFNFCHDTI